MSLISVSGKRERLEGHSFRTLRKEQKHCRVAHFGLRDRKTCWRVAYCGLQSVPTNEGGRVAHFALRGTTKTLQGRSCCTPMYKQRCSVNHFALRAGKRVVGALISDSGVGKVLEGHLYEDLNPPCGAAAGTARPPQPSLKTSGPEPSKVHGPPERPKLREDLVPDLVPRANWEPAYFSANSSCWPVDKKLK